MSLGNIISLTIIVLLPLIPAYLLYKLLPSTANVQGPWQGMQIKLGGAFAGYFVLVVTLLGFWQLLPGYEVWNVRGTLKFSDGQGAYDERTVGFSLKPPRISVYPDGTFDLAVFAMPDQSGNRRLPALIVEHAGYQPTVIDLERNGVKTRLKRHVVIPDTIVLRPVP